jgi:hypothetical protein
MIRYIRREIFGLNPIKKFKFMIIVLDSCFFVIKTQIIIEFILKIIKIGSSHGKRGLRFKGLQSPKTLNYD